MIYTYSTFIVPKYQRRTMYSIIFMAPWLSSLVCASQVNGVKPFVLQSNAINMPLDFICETPLFYNILQYRGTATIGTFDVEAFFTVVWNQDNGSLAWNIYKHIDSKELIRLMPFENIENICKNEEFKNPEGNYYFMRGTYEKRKKCSDGDITKMLMALCSYVGNDGTGNSSSLIILSIPHPNPRMYKSNYETLLGQVQNYFRTIVLTCNHV